MWRTYVICVLIGLLLVATSLSSLTLLRQSPDTASRRPTSCASGPSPPRRPARACSSRSTGSSATARGRQRHRAATPAATATATPQSGRHRQHRRRAPPPSPPAPTVTSADSPVLQQIETDVVNLRGLQPKSDVPLQFLDQAALSQLYFVDRFNQRLPAQRARVRPEAADDARACSARTTASSRSCSTCCRSRSSASTTRTTR